MVHVYPLILYILSCHLSLNKRELNMQTFFIQERNRFTIGNISIQWICSWFHLSTPCPRAEFPDFCHVSYVMPQWSMLEVKTPENWFVNRCLKLVIDLTNSWILQAYFINDSMLLFAHLLSVKVCSEVKMSIFAELTWVQAQSRGKIPVTRTLTFHQLGTFYMCACFIKVYTVNISG